VHRDRAFRLHQRTIGEILAKYEDESEELKKKLWSIVLDTNVHDEQRIKAIRELRNMSTSLIDRFFDAGIFERNLGKIKTESDLTKDEEEQIRQALIYAKYHENRKGTEGDTTENNSVNNDGSGVDVSGTGQQKA
jgi:hypothetical protein